MHLLYEGPSLIDGGPIVALASGIERPSTNTKTGPMVQTYILRSDTNPITAWKQGQDASICGDCIHRKGTCYVSLVHGTSSVYGAYAKGSYKVADDLTELGKGRTIRLGAYGDPAAVPIKTWDEFLAKARGWTGYTHSPEVQPDLRKYCQASCETEAQAHELQVLGWKTYRTKTASAPVLDNEIYCPSASGVSCYDCRLCNGRKKNIAIDVHGLSHKIVSFNKTYGD